jgi:hypothetical protein
MIFQADNPTTGRSLQNETPSGRHVEKAEHSAQVRDVFYTGALRVK